MASLEPEAPRVPPLRGALIACLAIVATLAGAAVLLLWGGGGGEGGGADGAGGGPAPPGHAGERGGHAERAATRFDRVGVANGELRPAGAGPARRAAYAGGGANGYARGIFDVAWPAGSTVTYGAEFRLPRGFHRRLQGQVALLRWDNWPSHRESADQGGIVIDPPRGQARLVWGRYHGAQQRLGRAFLLPEGRWFQLRVRQRLARGRPFSRVWLDGRLVATSRRPNFGGREVERLRVGIVAVEAGAQVEPLELELRRAGFARG